MNSLPQTGQMCSTKYGVVSSPGILCFLFAISDNLAKPRWHPFSCFLPFFDNCNRLINRVIQAIDFFAQSTICPAQMVVFFAHPFKLFSQYSFRHHVSVSLLHQNGRSSSGEMVSNFGVSVAVYCGADAPDSFLLSTNMASSTSTSVA